MGEVLQPVKAVRWIVELRRGELKPSSRRRRQGALPGGPISLLEGGANKPDWGKREIVAQSKSNLSKRTRSRAGACSVSAPSRPLAWDYLTAVHESNR